MRILIVFVWLVVTPFLARAQNYSDIWYNPGESGWGLTIADHQSQLFAVWFTYRQDGKPTWYVIPGGTFSNNRQRFQGDMYSTTGPAYSASPFDPTRVVATKVGTAILDFSSSASATFSYGVGGVTQSKSIQRQPFGDSAPTWGTDVTDIWLNPLESGWGLTLAQHGTNVFGVWFTYDTDGQPLWAVMPGVNFSNANTFTGNLFTTTGPYFASVPFDPSRVVATAQGSATITVNRSSRLNSQCLTDASAGFNSTFRGDTRSRSICQQSFGDAPATATTVFPNAPGLLEGNALFLAPANPLNVSASTDASTSASGLITVAGGSMTMTDAKGNQYTLTFPPNAVLTDTGVKMTALATLSGVSYASGVMAGVKLEPEGLVLQDSAILTITLATPIPLRNQTPFGATGDGRDLRFAAPAPGSQMRLYVPHFSIFGWFFMTPEERTNQMRIKLALENQARLENWIGFYLNALRQVALGGTTDENAPPPSLNQLAAWSDSFQSLVINPLLQAATANCANAMLAYDAVTKLRTLRQPLGLGPQPTFIQDIEAIKQALKKIGRPCQLEETGTMKDLLGNTAAFSVTWKTTQVDGDVYRYVPSHGHITLQPGQLNDGCQISSPTTAIDPATGPLLTIFFASKTYSGHGQQTVPYVIKCKDPSESSTTPYPVSYLGSGPEVTGSVSDTSPIIKGNSRLFFTTEWTFVRCSQYTAEVFCPQ